MPTFNPGDRVESLVNMQGLKRGVLYEVVDVLHNVTAFGTFDTVIVVELPPAESEARLHVTNAHLVLRPAPGPCAAPDVDDEGIAHVRDTSPARGDAAAIEALEDACLPDPDDVL